MYKSLLEVASRPTCTPELELAYVCEVATFSPVRTHGSATSLLHTSPIVLYDSCACRLTWPAACGSKAYIMALPSSTLCIPCSPARCWRSIARTAIPASIVMGCGVQYAVCHCRRERPRSNPTLECCEFLTNHLDRSCNVSSHWGCCVVISFRKAHCPTTTSNSRMTKPHLGARLHV